MSARTITKKITKKNKALTRQIEGNLVKARKIEAKIKKLGKEKNKLVDLAAKLIRQRAGKSTKKVYRESGLHSLPEGFYGPVHRILSPA